MQPDDRRTTKAEQGENDYARSTDPRVAGQARCQKSSAPSLRLAMGSTAEEGAQAATATKSRIYPLLNCGVRPRGRAHYFSTTFSP
jgi:hypothetical protein